MSGYLVKDMFVFVWRGIVAVITLPWYILRFIFGVRPPSLNDAEKGEVKPKGNEVLTSEEIQIVRQTWQLLANDRKRHGVEIMVRLFTLFPDSQTFFTAFKGIEPQNLRENKKMIGHATTFMYGVQSFVDNLEDIDTLVEIIKKLVNNHFKRGIGEPQFKMIAPTLCSYLHDVLGSDCTPFVTTTWTKVLTVVADISKKYSEERDTDGKAKGHELLTPEEIELLTSTWKFLAEDKVKHGQEIFIKLFQMYPETKNFFTFKDIPQEKLRGSRQLQAHVTTFMYGLQSFVDHADDLDVLVESIGKVTSNHLSRGIGAEQMKLIEPTLFAYLEDCLGGKFTAQTKTVWSKFLNVIVDTSKKQAAAN